MGSWTLFSYPLMFSVTPSTRANTLLFITLSHTPPPLTHPPLTLTLITPLLRCTSYYFVSVLDHIQHIAYSMCSLVVSVLDSPAVDPRSNPVSGSAILMSEKSQAVYYISSYHMLIDKALSSDKPNGHWFEAGLLHCKRDALSSNQKVDGSRLTGSTQACHP